MTEQQWTITDAGYGRDGWTLHRRTGPRGGWHLDSPTGERITFETDGGGYLACDMADEYIEQTTNRP